MSVSRETMDTSGPAATTIPALDVSRETLARLDLFATLFLRWNRRINLISRADEPRLWDRHIADALQLLPLLGPGTIADLGSGGGFPGLILAIATSRPVTLIESDTRKAAFLREAARETGANASVVISRIEDVTLAADIVTARALAPMPKLLGLAYPLLAKGGACLFLKGASAEQELTDCRGAWDMVVERHPSRIDRQGCILRLSEVSRV